MHLCKLSPKHVQTYFPNITEKFIDKAKQPDAQRGIHFVQFDINFVFPAAFATGGGPQLPEVVRERERCFYHALKK